MKRRATTPLHVAKMKIEVSFSGCLVVIEMVYFKQHPGTRRIVEPKMKKITKRKKARERDREREKYTHTHNASEHKKK